jgi:hypothetical protein
MTPRIATLFARREALQRRIERKRTAHASVAVEATRLRDATVEQLKAELRARRKGQNHVG